MAGEAGLMGQKSQKVTKWVMIALLIGLVVAIICLSWVPPVSRDELTHHLVVPKLYLAHGGIVEIPRITFSYYPMNLDLLYMVPLALGSDIAPKFVHFAFALLTAGLVFRYLREEIDVRYGLLGALAFLSIPVIVKLSVTAYVDLGLIFFSTATLLELLQWAKTAFRWRHLLIAAVSCGLALGTKYNGLIVLFCTALIVPLLYVRGDAPTNARQIKAVGMGAVFVVVAALVFSPWMIRDYIWTGNPVYPLYDKVFNPKPARGGASSFSTESTGNGMEANTSTVETTPEPGLGHFRMRKLVYGESGLEIILTPLRIFLQGRDDDPKYFDGKLNPLLLILPLIAVASWRKADASEPIRDQKVLLGFAVLYLLAAYLQTDMRIRWIAPIIPPLIILSMFGLWRLVSLARAAQAQIWRGLFGAASATSVVLLIGLNLAYVASLFEVIRPWGYISGNVSRAEYISQYRGEYAAIEYANQRIPQDARILAFYLGHRGYYSDRFLDCRYETFFDGMKEARSTDGLFSALRNKGFSHLLIRMDMFLDKVDGSMSPAEKRLLRKFFENHLREIFSANGYFLFALSDATSETENLDGSSILGE